MFVIGCKLGEDTYYVPEQFGVIGEYPQDIGLAKKFYSQQSALNFMRENAYDQNDWFYWQVITI